MSDGLLNPCNLSFLVYQFQQITREIPINLRDTNNANPDQTPQNAASVSSQSINNVP